MFRGRTFTNLGCIAISRSFEHISRALLSSQRHSSMWQWAPHGVKVEGTAERETTSPGVYILSTWIRQR